MKTKFTRPICRIVILFVFGLLINNTAQAQSCSIITTIAGNGIPGYSGDGASATSAELNQPYGLAVDGSGNFYIADQFNNRVRKVTASGTITTMAGNGTNGYSGDGGAATTAELNYPNGVAVDAAGNLYITDHGNNRIRKVNTSGIISTVAGNGATGFSGDGGAATAAQLNNPVGLATDAAGNMFIGDTWNNRIRKVNTSGIISTVAGTGTAGYTGDGGPATAAKLSVPYGVTIDTAGNLFIADRSNSCIRMVNSSGIISTIAGTGTGGFSGDGGAATLANIGEPTDVTVDRAGNVYIADFDNNCVRMVSPGGIINTFAGNDTAGFRGDGGPAIRAELTDPSNVVADSHGNIYISDEYNYRIRKVTQGAPYVAAISGPGTVTIGSFITLTDSTSSGAWSSSATSIATVSSSGAVYGVSAGTTVISYSVTNSCGTSVVTRSVTVYAPVASTCTIITTIAGNGTAGYSGDGGAATAAEINELTGVAVDTAGNVYIADYPNSRIRKVTPAGIITTVAGGSYGFSGDGGPATAAELASPAGVAVDRFGNIFIADRDNKRIRKVNASGTIGTYAGTGSNGFSGDGGPATAAQLYLPWGVGVDNAGNVYVADQDNQRIRKINTSGIITTIAGSGAFGASAGGFSGDGGAATDAVLNFPASVTIDNSGNIYIGDGNNFRIRKINTSGIINTIAGNGTSGNTGDGGPATAAETAASSVSVDTSGNIFIASGSVIRKVNSSGIISTVAGNGTSGFSGDGGVATAAEISSAIGVAADKYGNIYIADILNKRVRKVGPGIFYLASISGTTSMCTGATTTFTDSTAGGSWRSSNSSIATITSGGIVHGVSAGIDTIIYSDSNACGVNMVIHPLTVRSSAIGGYVTGPADVCQGATVTFIDTTAGGTWSSSAPGIATVNSAGVVTGVSGGSADIIYTVSSSCGSAGSSAGITVNPLPNPGVITGPSSACIGSGTVSLVDTIAGGSWSSFATSIATVNSSGAVSAVAPGTDTIYYSLSNTCGSAYAAHFITISSTPSAGTITGPSALCAGASATLSSGGSSGSGVWSSSNSSANVTDSIVTAVSAGIDTIQYAVANACGTDTALFAIIIHPLPAAGTISGPASVCSGNHITLTDAVSGGSWSASNTNASVSGGVVTGSAPGLDTIIYNITGTYCSNAASTIITIQLPPNVSAVTGPATVCEGASISFSDPTSGGTWHCSNAHASVSGGLVSGLSPGMDTVVYTVTNTCGAASVSAIFNVDTSVIPTVNILKPADTLCAMLPITLTAHFTNGGSSPSVTWDKNGVYVATGNTYTYPPNYGDRIACTLHSNAACRTLDSVTSDSVVRSSSPVTPFVTIHIVHDTTWYPGQIIAYDAEETYGGSDPQYQWYLNGNPVAGATNNAWSSIVYWDETVYCVVTSNLPCITYGIDTSNIITIHAITDGVSTLNGNSGIRLFPDPNAGSFTVSGNILIASGNEVYYEICDVAGRKLTDGNFTTQNGRISQNITLGEQYPGGQYFVRVISDVENKVFHFVLNR